MPRGTNRITVTSRYVVDDGIRSGPDLQPCGWERQRDDHRHGSPRSGTSTLTVTAGKGPGRWKATVTILRSAESSGETLFSLDFGPERSDWVWANRE